MRRILAIWLLFIFSSTQTEFGQLLRVPFLFEHFIKHHKQNKALSFTDFLKEHYTKEHQDNDKADDDRLPFKSSFSSPAAFMLLPCALEAPHLVISSDNKFHMTNDCHSLPQAFYSIFHPPCGIRIENLLVTLA